jgi:hypothetical protein
MQPTEDTLVNPDIPTVLTVGCSQAFVERCRRAVARLGVVIEPSQLSNFTTSAARCRPLVMVVLADVYQFDPGEFELLVRDVGSVSLVIEDEDLAYQELERRLSEAVRSASLRRAPRR